MSPSKYLFFIFMIFLSCSKDVYKKANSSNDSSNTKNNALKNETKSAQQDATLDSIILSSLELYNNAKDARSTTYTFFTNPNDLKKKLKEEVQLDNLQNVLIYFKSEKSIFFTLHSSLGTKPIDPDANYFHFTLSGDSNELKDYIKSVRSLVEAEKRKSEIANLPSQTGKDLYTEAIDLIPELNVYAVLLSSGKISNRKKESNTVYILDSKEGLLKKVELILQANIFNARNEVATGVNQLDQFYGNVDFIQKANRQFINGSTPSRKVLEKISEFQINKEQQEALNYFLKLQNDLETFTRLKNTDSIKEL